MRKITRGDFYNFILMVIFTVSMYPFSIDMGGSGLSSNYIYVFVPVLCLLTSCRRVVMRQNIALFWGICLLIFAAGLPEDFTGANPSPVRRLVSCVVFAMPFVLSCVEFTPRDVGLFKKAVMIISLYFSATSIAGFLSLNELLGIFELKGAVGSQRFGFVHCLALFIAATSDRLLFQKWLTVQRTAICLTILIGVLLTFSRAALVSLVLGTLVLSMSSIIRIHSRFDLIRREWVSSLVKHSSLWKMGILSLVLVAFVLGLQATYQTDITGFYKVRLIDPILDSSLFYSAASANPTESEGYRYYVLKFIIGYLADHPLFGSCFKGLYLLAAEFAEGASTHNQYSDVFLRTGIVGSIVWLGFLLRIWRFCRQDIGLMSGFACILVYGLFHETFKLAQGSFIFGMLLSFSYSLRRITTAPSLPTANPVNGVRTGIEARRIGTLRREASVKV
jgi:O-antigen ligase